MGASSSFWKICRISPQSERVGYEYCLVPTAQEFFQNKILELAEKKELSNLHNPQPGDILAALLSYFHAKHSAVDATIRAQAGLCLRCDVSYSILNACKKIDSLFGEEKCFTYRDLLPFVLNDDGKTLIVLDSDGKTQLILNDKGEAKTTAYKFFSVEILRTFKPNQSSMSLYNWAYLRTKQNQEIKSFLSEFGFKHLSDWAVMNRAGPKQIEYLSGRDRHLIKAFHAVYRRDRHQQRQKKVRRCPDPSSAQLQEMITYLQKRDVVINTEVELKKQLKQVVTQLRHYDIWSYREPLESYDPDTEIYTHRTDLPHNFFNELDVEQGELLEFLHQQLLLALAQGIEQEIGDRLTKLKKSKKYAPIAQQFIPGLQLYYCQGLSLKEIAPLLGMTSWDQARRVLNPGELLSKIRTLTLQQLLDSILKKAKEKGFTKIPPEPNYLKTLLEQIEACADEEIFQEAAAEIRTGNNRSMNSLYAQQLRLYFEQYLSSYIRSK